MGSEHHCPRDLHIRPKRKEVSSSKQNMRDSREKNLHFEFAIYPSLLSDWSSDERPSTITNKTIFSQLSVFAHCYRSCLTSHQICSFSEMSHRDNKDRRTLYCGNLHENVSEEMLFELFLQVSVDAKSTSARQCRPFFAFVERTARNSNGQTRRPPSICFHYVQTRRISSVRRSDHGKRLLVQSSVAIGRSRRQQRLQ